ncbi:hypothetical protein JCM31598_05740 [Desulfonatronum parangueonense]
MDHLPGDLTHGDDLLGMIQLLFEGLDLLVHDLVVAGDTGFVVAERDGIQGCGLWRKSSKLALRPNKDDQGKTDKSGGEEKQQGLETEKFRDGKQWQEGQRESPQGKT